MRKITFKSLALILCITLMVSCLPITVWATDVTPDEIIDSGSAAETPTEPYIVEEIESKRDAHTKHFRMSDGTYIAAQYDLPVHFEDETGVWQEYDNSLQNISRSTEEISNVKSDKTILLSKKAKQSKLVTLSAEGYEISWGYDKINSSPIEYENKTQEPLSTELVNITREAWYYDVYNGVDLQYFIMPTGVKENIVLNNKNTQKEFILNYKIGALSALQTDAQTIELRDSAGNAVYTIEAPVMTDAAENISDAVTLQIVKTTGNGITVKLSVDEEWLCAEDRVYPVYIDPWIDNNNRYFSSNDCYLTKSSSGSVSRNTGSRHYYTGVTSDGLNRSFLKISTPSLSTGDTPTQAILELNSLQNDVLGSGNYKVDIHMLTADWTVDNVGFNHSHDSNVLDYCIAGPDNGVQYYWDITRAVKHWYSSGTNYGLMLKGSVESGIVSRRFCSFKSSDEAARPTLTIYYVNMVGLNDFNSYKTYDYGAYGTLNLNEYRGSITYTFPDIAYSGNLLNTNIYHVYNSDWAGSSSAYGKGWKLNISEKLTCIKSTDKLYKEYYCTFCDEDGTVIYFKRTSSSTVHEDEVGRGWTLTSGGSGDWKFILEDKEGNKKGYDFHGRLRRIKDIHSNELVIAYASDDISAPITTVTDASGRVTNLVYANGLLTKITDPAGREINYIYDSNGYLLRAERYDGITPEFTMSSSRLYKASLGDSDLVILYHSKGTCKSLATAPKGSDGNRFLYWEKLNESTVYMTHQGPSESIASTASDRLIEVCLFNEWGQKITSYYKNTSGEIIGEIASATYVNSTQAEISTYTKKNNKVERSIATTSAVNLVPDGSFEMGGIWKTIYWASHTDTAAYLGTETNSANAYIGQDYGRITFNAPSERTVSLYQNITGLTEGETYTLSAYVKTENIQNGNGAFICATPYYTAGGSTDILSEYIVGTTDREIDNGWRRVSVTFTVPAAIKHIQIHAGIKSGSSGTVWFDCIQLEKGDEASDYNLVQNAGFEQSGYWTKHNGESADGIVGTEKFQGTGSYKMSGNYTINKHINQVIDVYGNAGDTYVLSAWAKGSSVPLTTGRNFYFECRIRYTDGTSEWPGIHRFTAYNSGWQNITFPIVMAADKQPQDITVYVGYFKNDNVCYFDDIQLIKDKSQSYVYDDEGNVTNAISAADQSSNFEYSNNEVVKSVASTGHKYYNTYDNDNEHLLIESYADGINYIFEHDAKGNITNAKSISSDIITGGTYSFRLHYENRAVDLRQSNTADGAELISFKWNNTTNQHFMLHRVDDTEYYSIHPVLDNDKALTVANAGTTSGTDILLYPYTGATHQQFKFVKQDNGSYHIFPRHDEAKCWDVTDTEGANLEISTANAQNSKDVVVVAVNQFYPDNQGYKNAYATYTASGQYTDTISDAAGNTVNYDYNEQKGELTAVTDAAGNKTAYINTPGAISTSTVFADTDKDGVLDEGEAFARYTSEKGLLKKVENNNNVYNFSYDNYGNRRATSVGNTTLINYLFNDNNGKLNSVVYGNGATVTYTYDKLNRVREINKGNDYLYRYTYDKKGNTSSLFDNFQNKTIRYAYDSIGRLVSSKASNGFGMYQNYDAYNRINKLTYTFGADSLTYRYNYNPKNLIGSVTLPTGKTLTNTYNALNMLKSRSINTTAPLNTTYSYIATPEGNTGLVETLTTAEGIFNYAYDSNGNITDIYKNGVLQEHYTYDALNQLKTVTNGTNVYEYTYDNGGNILNVKLNGTVTDTYVYGDENWKDKLTAYNGQAITYDNIGNPLQYRDGMSFNWVNGRSLYSVEQNNGAEVIIYEYNFDGARTEKYVSDFATNQYTTYNYEYNGTTLVRQSWGNNTIWFLYDESGNSVGFTLNGTEYYYIKNLQGDITAIADSTGTILAKYTYDVWGKILSITDANGNDVSANASHIANINPLRYRGYYYDSETGLYYLLSRYYDPETCRFVNADGLIDQSSALGYNLFAYCHNNPVNKSDTSGDIPFFAITAAAGAVFGAVAGGIIAAKNGGNVWAGIGIGAAAGALIGTGFGMAAGAALAGSITATTANVAFGASALATTVGTGGLGAGATYIANNLSQAANNLAPAAQTAASKMQEVATKGKAGEALSGLAKNTSHIPSLTGTASYRIPDGLDAGMRILSEVKNYSGTLSYTNQLKDFVMWSQANGYQMHLYTNATLTGPLQQVVDSGIIQLFPLG